MTPGDFKPLLTALVLPPAGPLLLALLALLLFRRRRAAGLVLATLGIAAALLLSTNAMGVLLARLLLPPMQPIQPEQLRQVQAIVVLGGGVWPRAPEYGSPQLAPVSLARLRYGVRLARRSGKPLGFAGGTGWGGTGEQGVAEAAIARQTLQEDYGLPLRWMDDRSRDTAQNAARMAEITRADGIRRIALVTDALHMPRAVRYFRQAGFEVTPAPTDFPGPRQMPLMEWLPSNEGILTCRYALREWLGGWVARIG